MQKHFFLFTIGPVQSFIGEARKTQDLYGGSTLLSDLMHEVINILQKQINATLIFPDVASSSSLPNRLLALVENSKIRSKAGDALTQQGVSEIQWLGQYLQDQVKTSFISKGEKIAKSIPNYQNCSTSFRNQLANHLEIYWAAYPMEEEKYLSSFIEVHRLLGSVKHSRVFSAMPEQGRKCHLDGNRNALIYRPTTFQADNNKLPLGIDKNEALIIDNQWLNQGEGLSAISFIKRRYRYNPKNPFDSTTEIALLHALETLMNTKNEKLINNIQFIKSINSQLFFEENTRSPIIERILKDERSSLTIKNIQKTQKEITKAVGELNLSMNKYYAIVLFDGDNMGKWWSAEETIVKNGINTLEFHQDLSKALAEFSVFAKNILETLNGKRGRLVYAGGDDFLGFINLEYLLQVMVELREGFDQKINNKIKRYIKEGVSMSFSAGIVIAHYKEPLRLVMNRVRDTEKAAKKWRKEKDSCGLQVMRSSGEPSLAVFPFYDKTSINQLVEIQQLMKVLSTNYAAGTIDKIIRHLEDFPLSYLRLDYDQDQALLRPKLWQHLSRSCLLSLRHPDYESVMEQCFDLLWRLATACLNWQNYLSALETIGFLIRHTSLQKKLKYKNHADANRA